MHNSGQTYIIESEYWIFALPEVRDTCYKTSKNHKKCVWNVLLWLQICEYDNHRIFYIHKGLLVGLLDYIIYKLIEFQLWYLQILCDLQYSFVNQTRVRASDRCGKTSVIANRLTVSNYMNLVILILSSNMPNGRAIYVRWRRLTQRTRDPLAPALGNVAV